MKQQILIDKFPISQQNKSKKINGIQGEANFFLKEDQIKCNDCEANKANLCTRFLRKKYTFCLLWLLTIIKTTQLLYIIFDKIDTSLVENLT